MASALTEIGANKICEARLNDAWPTGGKNLYLNLYINNETPTFNSISTDFTVCPSEAGYSRKTLTCGSWTITMETGADGYAKGEYAAQTFTFTEALTGDAVVYGFYISDEDGDVIWAEDLPTPITPVSGGVSIIIIPNIYLAAVTTAAFFSSVLAVASFLEAKLNDTFPYGNTTFYIAVFWGYTGTLANDFSVSNFSIANTTSLGALIETLSSGWYVSTHTASLSRAPTFTLGYGDSDTEINGVVVYYQETVGVYTIAILEEKTTETLHAEDVLELYPAFIFATGAPT